MGLKKYEIITVGSDKRVRALRSWQVGDRYVNIGDVGGIVYDEKTLSQDGACWLFRGNFGFPGARIGGDSIVDIGEAALSATGAPNVDILGSSVVVGSKLQFLSDQTEADAVVLTANDFEQGILNYAAGVNWEDMKASSPTYIRTKSPIFAGGASVTLKCEAPGYLLHWFALDRDGIMTTASATVATGEGVTTTIVPCQYFLIRLTKNPAAATVPADATAAQITFKGTYETKLSIIDSRVEINPATSAGVLTLRPGGSYNMVPGAKYPETIIRNSKVSLNVPAAVGRSYRIIGKIIESNVTLDATVGDVRVMGQYSNIKNLTAAGLLSPYIGVNAYSIIQAYNCDNFAVSPTFFPGLEEAQTANTPFIFQGCNVPGGRFYHHAQIANTYKNIDFALARADLGKSIASGEVLASSEVEGMYRLYSTTGTVFGALAEAHDSVKSLNMTGGAATYGTTIYKDAYFNGLFDFAGTNVFGNTKKHDTQDVSGCKIVNTGATAVNMKGNIRVEGNATLTNCSIIGSGYFGGNCVASGLVVNGCAFMKDYAKLVKTSEGGTIRRLYMRDNSYAEFSSVAVFGLLDLRGNATFAPSPYSASEADIIMRDNSAITSGLSVNGVVTMKDNAKVSGGTITTAGDITICGSYNQTTSKSWAGKRTITDVNAPEYDNNVKTQYDF